MRKIVLILVVLLLAVTLTYAQEPDASPSENACNPGGALEGKCNSEWHWTCGWYLAQFYEGKAASVPSDCQILVDVLPPDLQKPGALVYVGSYNPEPGTAADNACNEGGSMWRENPVDGCTSDWHWTCGWYLARYDAGVFTSVPAICQILLDVRPPKLLEEEQTGSSEVCIIIVSAGGARDCISGNVMTIDNAPPDGIVDDTYILLKDAIAGPSGGCPIGTIYLSDNTAWILETRTFILSQGFPLTGDICRVP